MGSIAEWVCTGALEQEVACLNLLHVPVFARIHYYALVSLSKGRTCYQVRSHALPRQFVKPLQRSQLEAALTISGVFVIAECLGVQGSRVEFMMHAVCADA